MINLEKETLWGYEVSAKMKRIWAMELEMLQRFVEVCEEHQLRYWIVDGTLLGAVRHKGFIPWDNDIDVAMPRDDFNRLLEIGPSAFLPPFFFQTPVTEDACYFSTYVKIRNEKGTAAAREEFETGMNCGIFIDVFCLDLIPDSPILRKLYYWHLNEISKMSRFALGKPLRGGWLNTVKHALQKTVYSLVYGSPDAAGLFLLYQKAAGRYAQAKCRRIANRDFGYHEQYIWDKKDWDEVVELDFEGMKLNAPAGYDAILKHEYGDYWQIPENKSTHDYYDFDPDIPYDKYFR